MAYLIGNPPYFQWELRVLLTNVGIRRKTREERGQPERNGTNKNTTKQQKTTEQHTTKQHKIQTKYKQQQTNTSKNL